MALLLQLGEEVLPAQTPELVLNRSGREVSRPVPWPVALCPRTRKAPGGQAGIGAADQGQGCHGRPIGALLVVAKPPQRLQVLPPRLDGPAPIVGLEEWGGRARWVVGHQPAALPGPARAREDHRPPAQRTHLEPAGLDAAIACLALRLDEDEGVGAAPPPAVPPLAAGFALPAWRQEAAVALACGGDVTVRRPTRLAPRATAVVRRQPAHHLDAARGLHRPDQPGRQRRGLPN